MGFELPNGKTARNIQEQVAFLTEKVKELFAAVSDLGFKVVKVDVLPEEGAARTIYLVPSDDPEEENAFNEYLWTEDGWELIGSTAIDLSNYVDLTSAQTISGNKAFSGVASFIGGANFNGPIKTSFYPETPNSYDLGLSGYTWRDLYLSGNAYFENKKEIQFKAINSSHYFYIKASENTFNIGAVGIVTSLVLDTYLTKFAPAGNSQDLGANNALWRDIFLSRNLTDGTNSATVADIAALITYAKAQGWIS